MHCSRLILLTKSLYSVWVLQCPQPHSSPDTCDHIPKYPYFTLPELAQSDIFIRCGCFTYWFGCKPLSLNRVFFCIRVHLNTSMLLVEVTQQICCCHCVFNWTISVIIYMCQFTDKGKSWSHQLHCRATSQFSVHHSLHALECNCRWHSGNHNVIFDGLARGFTLSAVDLNPAFQYLR